MTGHRLRQRQAAGDDVQPIAVERGHPDEPRPIVMNSSREGEVRDDRKCPSRALQRMAGG